MKNCAIISQDEPGGTCTKRRSEILFFSKTGISVMSWKSQKHWLTCKCWKLGFLFVVVGFVGFGVAFVLGFFFAFVFFPFPFTLYSLFLWRHAVGSHKGIRKPLDVLSEGLWLWEALPMTALGTRHPKGQHLTEVLNNICTRSSINLHIYIFEQVTEQLASCSLI